MIFSSPANKAKAEILRGQILQAFESTLHSEVILEIRCDSRKDMSHKKLDMIKSENSSQMASRHHSIAYQRSCCSGPEDLMKMFPGGNGQGIGSSHGRRIHTNMANGEITEIVSSPQDNAEIGLTNGVAERKEQGLENVWLDEASSLQRRKLGLSQSRENDEQRRRQSLVRGKVSLARVIQRAEGCAQQGDWSRRKAISIAEKLEQENL